MRPFAYARPKTLAHAFDLLAGNAGTAALLAGGTDLIVRLRLRHVRPDVVVDLKHVDELSDRIDDADGFVRIGARTVMTTIGDDERMRHLFPALVESARVVGSVQIRNRATLAGNICNASPAADTVPALLVYGALVNARSRAGARRVPLATFFTGPGRTVLEKGEIVESIDLPRPAAPTGSAFGRVTRRYGVDLATINLCCLVDERGRVRLACGAVAPTPFVIEHDLPRDAPTLNADTLVAEVIARAAPISDVRGSRDYRLAMLDVMTRRALAAARERLTVALGGRS